MSKKLTKNRKKILEKIDNNNKYSLEEAFTLIKKISFSKFDESIDISIRLGLDSRLSNQIVRGTVLLPHGIGKNICVLALVTKDKELESKEAGADYVGLEYIEKIKSGWIDIDVIVAIPSVMNQLGTLGKILGPRGLMPNPKLDTVSTNPGKSIKEIKSGKIIFKADRYGIIHSSIGRVSFSTKYLLNNLKIFINEVIRNKPSSSKGFYIKKIYLSTTMSPSILLDTKSFLKK
ncbi:50S ribosomal protein L1 [Blattabacterium punctulatus]|uniref:Large ribosomal subunit protein uL1 n=1 Tax=Blattabacterium punctulatus TaxID=164514 RepID=A0ABM6WN62_9FLAO|nr:50S ribosomal protein L1 [Blattabacterium punctulatus]AWU39736.1 50S ribosomal protein L1 [Blattabacterium punctulatus]AWU40281.1 50S ribosomal protein L1 [Blattabacterium punctulatus]AWU44732.1 50S ribosomal protein L1 [Blattabacterium punctulatus]